jgi:hypothetical protein
MEGNQQEAEHAHSVGFLGPDQEKRLRNPIPRPPEPRIPCPCRHSAAPGSENGGFRMLTNYCFLDNLEICVEGATPVSPSTWGQIKTVHR